MRIGIDIDDTLTDVKDELIEAGEKYARSLGKDIKVDKNFEDKNNIYYDKLVVNARDKKIACIEEKIDLFIDDSESNCLNVKKAGIKTIRVCNEIENNNSNLICFNNWNDIYSYIQTIKYTKKEG